MISDHQDLPEHRFAEIRDVLVKAVLSGASAILRMRCEGPPGARIKHGRELVTAADEASDAAILSIFQSDLTKIDPEICFHLEESGHTGQSGKKKAGADPLDGTNHFACGGNLYAVQAHYVEDGIPRVGVVLQPEVYLPLAETEAPTGRLVSAIRGRGAFIRRTQFNGRSFTLGEERRVFRAHAFQLNGFVACVPFSTKMSPEERETARRVHESGIIAVTTGAGSAAANVMMTIFGGQHVYANFGAGEDLDLIPPQVIALEAGLTVWDARRETPVWHVTKQPFIVAPDAEAAGAFLDAAGL